MSPGTIYRHTRSGHRICGCCEGLDGAHAAACAVVTMHTQLQELVAALGAYVAQMRETVDGLELVLRGDAPEGTDAHGVD